MTADRSDASDPETDENGSTRTDENGSTETGELSEELVRECERLTRLARDAADDREADIYRSDRDERLAAVGYAARFRDEDETLVLYPEEWVEDGTARLGRIEDTDRAVEVPLGAVEGESYAAVERHNSRLVETIEAEHGPEHAANVRRFADFMANHYLGEIDAATADQCREFLEEYYPRNTWPSETEAAIVERSIELVFETAGRRVPEFEFD